MRKNIYYPRAVCNHCGSPNTSWRIASGKGVIYSTSVERTKPEAGGKKYIALVDLKEGGRLMSRVVDMVPSDVTIGMQDVDGLFVSSMARVFHPLHAAEYLGIQPSVIDGTNIGGSSFVDCVQSAVMAIKTGVCNVALIAYGSTSRSNRKRKFREGNPNAGALHASEYQPRNPIISYAFAAARHMHEFGTTRENLAQVAVSTREWAMKNPRAFAMAGLSPSDIDVAEFYDAFTINTILFLEDLGFCKKGEGGAFVGDGKFGPGGTLPVNTNGGGLSCVHPGMYGMFVTIEAVEQLRGVCGERQIEGANTALANGNGGVLSSQVTAIYGSEATL